MPIREGSGLFSSVLNAKQRVSTSKHTGQNLVAEIIAEVHYYFI